MTCKCGHGADVHDRGGWCSRCRCVHYTSSTSKFEPPEDCLLIPCELCHGPMAWGSDTGFNSGRAHKACIDIRGYHRKPEKKEETRTDTMKRLREIVHIVSLGRPHRLYKEAMDLLDELEEQLGAKKETEDAQ